MLKKKIKFSILIAITVIVICIIPYYTNASSDNLNRINHNDVVSASNPEYVVTDYKIKVNVNKNNTYDVKEDFMIRFDAPIDSIYRTLMLKTKIKDIDGSILRTDAEIQKIKTYNHYTVSSTDECVSIKLDRGGESRLGYENFTLKYQYNSGKDKFLGKDEFCYELINGHENTDVAKLEFEITMPEAIDIDNIKIYTGKDGLTVSDNISYTVENNVLKGLVDKVIRSGEKVLVRIDLPEGYFKNAKSKPDYFSIFVIAISVIFASIGLLIWNDFGKDRRIRKKRNTYPNLKYNSSNVAFYYNSDLELKSIVALLIDLANKGYLKIIKVAGDYKIVRLKEYEGNDLSEKMFFDGLFKKRRNENK